MAQTSVREDDEESLPSVKGKKKKKKTQQKQKPKPQKEPETEFANDFDLLENALTIPDDPVPRPKIKKGKKVVQGKGDDLDPTMALNPGSITLIEKYQPRNVDHRSVSLICCANSF
jgi:hypothetical protein